MTKPIEIWRTQFGGDVQIKQMETSHIHHCLRLMEQHFPWRHRYWPRLMAELEKRRTEGPEHYS